MLIKAFRDLIRGLLGPAADDTNTDADLAAKELYRQTHVVNLLTSANAATNTTAQYFGCGAEDVQRRVLHAKFWPDAALDLSSDNGTNNVVFEVAKAYANGATTTVVANAITSGSATNLVVGIPYSLTLQCTTVLANQVLTARIGKNGTGQAITTGRFEVRTEAM